MNEEATNEIEASDMQRFAISLSSSRPRSIFLIYYFDDDESSPGGCPPPTDEAGASETSRGTDSNDSRDLEQAKLERQRVGEFRRSTDQREWTNKYVYVE